MSPFTAWVMLKGLETLDLRVRAQAANAQAVAESVQHHPALARVLFPGLAAHPQYDLARARWGGGTVLSLDLKGGQPAPSGSQRAEDRADIEQPRRRQDHRHPSPPPPPTSA